MKTDISLPRFFSEDAKKAGRHSRRNQTRAAQDLARETYQSQRGKKARQRRAQERLAK